MPRLFESGSGISFLTNSDAKKYGYRIEVIGRVSDAIETHDIDAMYTLIPICERLHMPRAIKRMREELESPLDMGREIRIMK